MIEWVHIAVQARSKRDFELLTKLLDTLGLRARDLENYGSYRLQTFLPPVAALEIIHKEEPDEDADLELTISDPDSAVESIKRIGLAIDADSSGPDPTHTVRHFKVRLPDGTAVNVTGFRVGRKGSFDSAGVHGNLRAEGRKFAIVVSRFNAFIVERLLSGALDALNRCGADKKDSITIVRVPGSFEIPSAARTLAETRKYDAIICLGCLLRGDTAHYDVIVNEVARGIGQSAQETGVPHAFGVLTCDTLEQAIDRAGLKMGNKGFEAALAAVEMANLKKAFSSQPSAVSKTMKKAFSSELSAIRKKRKPKTPQRKRKA